MANAYDKPNSAYWRNYGAMYTQTVADLVKNGFSFNLQSYPIWRESAREELNNLIINHYYMYEIGFETEGQWNLALGTKMAEIMPYYNRIMEAAELEYDPLEDHNYKETHTETQTEDTTDATTLQRTWSETSLHSDTPQNDLSNVFSGNPEGIVAHYLTDAQHSYGNESHSGDKDIIDTDKTRDYQKVFEGREHPAQELALQYAETANRVYSEILKELEPLFMGLFR